MLIVHLRCEPNDTPIRNRGVDTTMRLIKKIMTNKQNHNHHIFCIIKSLRWTKSDAPSNVCQRFFPSSYYVASCVCLCCQSTEISTRHLNTWNFHPSLLLALVVFHSFRWQIAWCTDPFCPPFILCIERIHNVLYLIHEPKEIIWQPYKPGKCLQKKNSIARSERYIVKRYSHTYLFVDTPTQTQTHAHTYMHYFNEKTNEMKHVSNERSSSHRIYLPFQSLSRSHPFILFLWLSVLVWQRGA